MTIQKKLLIGFGFVLIIAMIAFISVYYSLIKVGDSYNELADEEMEKLTLAQEIQYEDLALSSAVKGLIIAPGNEKDSQSYEENAVQIEENIEEVLTLISDERSMELLEEVNSHNTQLIELEDQMMALAQSNRETTLDIYNGEYSDLRTIFNDNLEEFKQIQQEAMDSKVAADERMIQSSAVYGIIAIIVMLGAGVILSIMIARKTTKPLKMVVEKLEELSRNEGDLTARLNIKSKDEVGQLASAFNGMVGNIQKLIQQVKHNTEEVASSTEELAASSQQSQEATNHITTSIQEVASGAETQSSVSEENTSIVKDISQGVSNIDSLTSSVLDSSLTMTEEAKEGQQIVQRSIHQMNKVEKTMGNASEKVGELNNLSGEIGQISNLITDIAEQTNLLALNAAIEAARAGESGKGFAVVAEEVRKLADESKTSASKIDELIKEVQTSTFEAVQSMNEGTSEMQVGINDVQAAGSVFEGIISAVENTTEQIKSVSSASNKLSTGTANIQSSINHLAEVSKASTDHSQQVAGAAEEQLASAEETQSAIENLSNMAAELQNHVGRFKV
ncbi:methyl-accepting chemotaxis protein [Alteribacillus sp. YIM 98480]|uniref:methyl-accepting chemotaxis protein n=1 Tax=Alteribacillus sp. YIM 98480 TaxID=2606599 RepID=UPI00131CBB77|nr:methyl-accepting chemotaxis protein [Alteribacillus sp. YIM 98480]